jgi:hypothetical protein
MYRGGFFLRLLAFLLLAGLLLGGGYALYRLGWSQGYQSGALAAAATSGESLPTVPYAWGAPYPYAPYGFGFPFFPPFGICLGIGFFFLVLFLIGGLFRWGGRRRWTDYGTHGGWDPDKVPPWMREKYARHMETPEKAESPSPSEGDQGTQSSTP